jgi:hypothetical protein
VLICNNSEPSIKNKVNNNQLKGGAIMERFKLFEEIINRSNAKEWEDAKSEWILKDISISDYPESCLCGHYPIKELCFLRNIYTGQEVIIGNCCVKKFIAPESDRMFQAVKRVKRDESKSLNSEMIEHAFEKCWINDWEYFFYQDTFKKRNLSHRQLAKRKAINEKILERI